MNNEPDLKIRENLINIFNSKKYSELIKTASNLTKDYPRSLFLFSILGSTQNELENYKDSIICFQKTIEINPNFSDGYYNLGIVYRKVKEIEKSINNYNYCLEFNPKKFEAYNNLGNIYKDKQNIDLAVECYVNCLEINPNYNFALQNFGICLQNYKLSKRSNVIEKHIISLLEKNKILRPVDIINSLISYMYLDTNLNNIILNFESLKKSYSLDKLLTEFLNFKILVKLLKITPITDIQIEKFLRFLRYEILLNIESIKDKEMAFNAMELIASQCFINEYIYPIKKKEEDILNIVEQKIKNIKGNSFKNVKLEITCLAAYKSLNTFTWSNKLIDTNIISNLIKQQIINPKKEENLKKEIYTKNIKNLVSLKVKDQYENNPYPRWEKIALNNNHKEPFNFFNNLELNFKKENMKEWKNIEVLVAGCGTGQHAITTATKYKNSFITAIDLSANSLSFAKRKAIELEINNIDFVQMDLLDLKYYGKEFHIIESVGVLHHMDDPYKGWQVLYEILKSDGMIMIGLYSKLAREHIKRIRSKIKKRKIEANNKNIIKFREEILFSNENDEKIIKNSPDFYSLSNFRDLLFHVQEYRFDIDEINNFLKKINLKFCGFENQELINLFKNEYIKKVDLYDLKNWKSFEIKNPRIFAGMYQFWCQKIDSFEI